jgi:antitoxin PrlF
VRNALELRQGDEIACLIEARRVTLSKAKSKARMNDPFATFAEWDSGADRKAYKQL